VKATASKSKGGGSKVQGEGDYEAARHYRGKLKTFIATHDVEKVARAAAPRSAAEAKSMQKAEAVGKSKSKAVPKGKATTRQTRG
jgi:hypothetical protein